MTTTLSASPKTVTHISPNAERFKVFMTWVAPAVAIPALRYQQDDAADKKKLFIRDASTYTIGAGLFIATYYAAGKFLNKAKSFPFGASGKSVAAFLIALSTNLLYAGIGAVKVSKMFSERQEKQASAGNAPPAPAQNAQGKGPQNPFQQKPAEAKGAAAPQAQPQGQPASTGQPPATTQSKPDSKSSKPPASPQQSSAQPAPSQSGNQPKLDSQSVPPQHQPAAQASTPQGQSPAPKQEAQPSVPPNNTAPPQATQDQPAVPPKQQDANPVASQNAAPAQAPQGQSTAPGQNAQPPAQQATQLFFKAQNQKTASDPKENAFNLPQLQNPFLDKKKTDKGTTTTIPDPDQKPAKD